MSPVDPEDLLHVTLASIGDAVIASDVEGRVTFLNPVAEGLTGWSTEDAVGQPLATVFRIVNEQTREPVDNPAEKALRLGQTVGLANHTLLIAKDGTERPIEDSAAPIRDGDGRVLGVVLVFRDVTERKRAEAAEDERNRVTALRADVGAALAASQSMQDGLQACCEALVRHLDMAFARVWILNPASDVLELVASAGIYTHLDGPHGRVPVGEFKIGRIAASREPHLSNDVPHDPNVSDQEWARREGMIAFAGYPLLVDGRCVGVVAMFSREPLTDGVLTELAPLADWTALYVVRRRVETQLHDARARLEATLAAGEVGTWDWDVTHDRVYADRNLASMFGVSPEAAAGGKLDTFVDAIHVKDRDRVAAAIGAAIESGDEYETQYRLVLPGQDVKWVVARGVVERDESGRAVRLPGVVIDVTDRVESQQKFVRLAAESQRQKRLYETALSNTLDFLYLFDLKGRFTFVNRALLALWGKTLDEAVGKTFHELDYPPELAAQLQREIQEVIGAKQPLKGETPYTGIDANERLYEYIFVPVFDAEGEVDAVAGSTRDVTDSKNLEFELRQIAADLSTANQRKTEFLATLGHELRNPLAPIRTGLELMKLVSDDPETMEETRSMMERQVQQMIRLIDDLLDVSRITQGKMELRTCRVALADVIRSAVEATRPFIDEAGHDLTVTLPSRPIEIDGDPNRLAQVVSNLLNNSVKYTPEGGRISLTVEREETGVAITIADSGIGIPPELQAGVFEMFNQIDRPLEKGYKGLGIGLTLVKRLVEMHGGTIEVESEGTDKGSVFRVRLPVVAGSADDDRKSTLPDAAGASSRIRVLVVDDNRAAADMLGMVVKMLGNDVRTAYDGVEGVAAADEFRPDVVLMDLGMPRMNGYEAARHIRGQAWGASMMLVALTGWGQDEDRRRTDEAGFDHHLVKPAEPAALQKLFVQIARN